VFVSLILLDDQMDDSLQLRFIQFHFQK